MAKSIWRRIILYELGEKDFKEGEVTLPGVCRELNHKSLTVAQESIF